MYVACKSILGYLNIFVTDKQVLKKNKDTIENLDLENKATYL